MRIIRFNTLAVAAACTLAGLLGPLSNSLAAPASKPPVRMLLWPGPAPVAEGQTDTNNAVLTIHHPEKPNGTAVVICPGGGYSGLVTGAEGHGIAQWLKAHGITGVVLEYRLPAGRTFVPLLDAQRALRTVRANAGAWGLKPDRIGIIGFSAGGHLASTAGTHFDAGNSAATDAVARVSCRPDFMILIYPVVSMGAKAHGGTKANLLGPNSKPELIRLFSNEQQVTDQTPPAFLAHAKDDTVVAPDNSADFYAALQAHHIPAQYLELPSGGHGLNGYKGPRWDAWQTQSLAWLVAQKLTEPAAEVGVYQNPIDFSYPYQDGTRERQITELRDPAIIREGNLYYLTFTVFPFTHSDSRQADKPDFNSPPGIMLYSSPDLKAWKFEKWLIKSSDLPENCPYKHRFWASEIHKINGKCYLIFTADNWIKDEYNKGGKIGAYVAFVGVADQVTGPYEHITWLKGAGCDSTLFGDDDGKTYAIMPFGNEYIQEVDLSGIQRGDIKLIGERKMIVARDNSDVGKKTSPDYMEGPWLIKRHGKYVLFTAAPYRGPKRGEQPPTPPDLAQGYWVGAAVADNIWGPYRKEPQVFLGGHIAVFTGPDGKEWFSYRGEAGGKAQGRLCIDLIQFNTDGSVRPFQPSTDSVTTR